MSVHFVYPSISLPIQIQKASVFLRLLGFGAALLCFNGYVANSVCSRYMCTFPLVPYSMYIPLCWEMCLLGRFKAEQSFPLLCSSEPASICAAAPPDEKDSNLDIISGHVYYT